MKALLGFILTGISLFVVIISRINIAERAQALKNDPWGSLFQDFGICYTFTPPFTGFEIFILAMGIVGIILLISAVFMNK